MERNPFRFGDHPEEALWCCGSSASRLPIDRNSVGIARPGLKYDTAAVFAGRCGFALEPVPHASGKLRKRKKSLGWRLGASPPFRVDSGAWRPQVANTPTAKGKRTGDGSVREN